MKTSELVKPEQRTRSVSEPRGHAAHPGIETAIEQASAFIAPTWPLDRFIAVNPFWGMIGRPFSDVAATLCSLSGARLLMPRAWYRQERAAGRLRDEHLRTAIVESSSATTLDRLLELLEEEEPAASRRRRVVDIVDDERDLDHEVAWSEFVTNSLSQFCAAYFDEGQATLGPNREGGLYASWRRQALSDKGPRLLMGNRRYAALVDGLPSSASEMVRKALTDLQVPEDEWVPYLAGLLLDINGWASWCMYRRWTARLAGGDDHSIVDLLGMRIAWEWLLLGSGGDEVRRRWKRAVLEWPRVDAIARATRSDDVLFQRAVEIAWQREVSGALPRGLSAGVPQDAAVQAVFCIDVRSEVFRRALEAETPAVQTLGFAGFFGLPVEYRPTGCSATRPQLPGLLAPKLRVTDAGIDAAEVGTRVGRLDRKRAWSTLKSSAVSTFPFVEAMGIPYAWQLLTASLGKGRPSGFDDVGLSHAALGRRKLRLSEDVSGRPLSDEARSELAAGILRAMSLTRGFARLVLLAGHGSETRNNPHAAGLDCGACCGQTGEVNARAAAALFNDPAVREGLLARGIEIPASTIFVAGLHNTTTDELTLFDLDEVPSSHATDVSKLRQWLEGAGSRARAERAKKLGLGDASGEGLRRALRKRAQDWAQVRPEWGLANNASFIVAPREHSRHLNLEGRCFLHEYRFQEDTDFVVLEQIMTAPMVVAHWINLQYYASTVDNARYGSGNKVLHNVVGGHIGVFEGNSGDLRIGLPMQSVHDGERFVHSPHRLSVFIEAPRQAIEAVLSAHENVLALVMNGWLELFQVDAADRAVYAYREGNWWKQETDHESGN